MNQKITCEISKILDEKFIPNTNFFICFLNNEKNKILSINTFIVCELNDTLYYVDINSEILLKKVNSVNDILNLFLNEEPENSEYYIFSSYNATNTEFISIENFIKNKINNNEIPKTDIYPIEHKLNEGIAYSRNEHKVYYVKDESIVDTSIKNNPTYYVDEKTGVKVWSIFHRFNTSYPDGNPLIQALKGGDYTFATKKDYDIIWDRIDKILDKFLVTKKHDVSIIIPSKSILNMKISKKIIEKKGVENTDIIRDLYLKMSAEEVYNLIDNADNTCPFKQQFKGNRYEVAMKLLGDFVTHMNDKYNGIFRRHFLDKSIRDAVDETLSGLKISGNNYASMVNDKDVLIIDDTIHSGASIRDAIDIMSDNYKPSSITALTVMSKADNLS